MPQRVHASLRIQFHSVSSMSSFPNLSSLHLVPALAFSFSAVSVSTGLLARCVCHVQRERLRGQEAPSSGILNFSHPNKRLVLSEKHCGYSVSVSPKLLQGTVMKKPLNNGHMTARLVMQRGVKCRSGLKLEDLSQPLTLTDSQSHVMFSNYSFYCKNYIFLSAVNNQTCKYTSSGAAQRCALVVICRFVFCNLGKFMERLQSQFIIKNRKLWSNLLAVFPRVR